MKMPHNRKFLFSDFHGCEQRVALYQSVLYRDLNVLRTVLRYTADFTEIKVSHFQVQL